MTRINLEPQMVIASGMPREQIDCDMKYPSMLNEVSANDGEQSGLHRAKQRPIDATG